MICNEQEQQAQQEQQVRQHDLTPEQDITQDITQDALSELKQQKQWVNWISNPGAKGDKVPVRPNGMSASSTDPTTWSTYEDVTNAVAASSRTPGSIGGIGFVLADGYCGQDFDDVIIEGKTEPWVTEEIARLNTYTEVSPSGTGYHCIGRAKLPGTGRKRPRAETYDSGRYFTFTGNHVPGTPDSVNHNQAAAESFYKRIDTVDPKCEAKPKPDPFAEFRSLLKGRTIEDLLADDAVSLTVTEKRHDFLLSVVGLLWDGKRTHDELASIARAVEERFCVGTREVTDKEIARMVTHCISGDPNQSQSNQPSESPSQKYKDELLAAPWFQSADGFIAENIPPKTVLVSDKTGNPILTSASVNQIFAFRGYGKSMLMLGVVDLLIHGGEMLGWKSEGGLTVLLCDGELPPQDLQKRLTSLVGDTGGRLKLMSTHNLPRHAFPALSDPDYQEAFLRQVDELKPDVIVFDTLTACFRFDTNDTDAWLVVNQFLVNLRLRGICVILTHHAGKNGTQRGRTDGDDNLDLVIKLDAPSGHTAGMGLRFVLSYEKVRADSRLSGFEGMYDEGEWQVVTSGEFEQAVAALNDNKTYKWIEAQLGISSKTTAAYKKKAEALGLLTAKEAK